MKHPKQWMAGLVRRWHANPYLAHTNDSTAAHSGRMAAMAVNLGWIDILPAIVTHDTGEIVTGDIPWGQKSSDTESRERDARIAMGLETGGYDDPRVKFLDRLDAYLWAWMYEPVLMTETEWRDQRFWLLETMKDYGITSEETGVY